MRDVADPVPVLVELTRFARALTGALRRETVAQCTVESLERLFPPASAAVATVEEVWAEVEGFLERGEFGGEQEGRSV